MSDRWRDPVELEVGGLSRAQLFEALRSSGVSLNARAEALIAHPVFDERVREPVRIVDRTVAELGLTDRATMPRIFAAAEEHGLGLCPVVTGPYLRLAWATQTNSSNSPSSTAMPVDRVRRAMRVRSRLAVMSSTPQTAATIVLAVAYAGFAALGIVLAAVDARTHRLPNALVLPAYPVTLALFGIACLLGADPAALLSALVGMVGMLAFFVLLGMIGRGSMGGGDIKLAGVVGLYLGWLGWTAVLVGLIATFVLGGLFGLALLALRRARGNTRIAFGPWMIVGAWTGILAAAVA